LRDFIIVDLCLHKAIGHKEVIHIADDDDDMCMDAVPSEHMLPHDCSVASPVQVVGGVSIHDQGLAGVEAMIEFVTKLQTGKDSCQSGESKHCHTVDAANATIKGAEANVPDSTKFHGMLTCSNKRGPSDIYDAAADKPYCRVTRVTTCSSTLVQARVKCNISFAQQ
jgi:hypothetical protein